MNNVRKRMDHVLGGSSFFDSCRKKRRIFLDTVYDPVEAKGDRMQERKIIALLRERDEQGLHALLVHDGPLCDTSSLPFCGTLRSGRSVFPR